MLNIDVVFVVPVSLQLICFVNQLQQGRKCNRKGPLTQSKVCHEQLDFAEMVTQMCLELVLP